MQEIQSKRKLQQGSIMLEVIAVLALMGVMGAMLFRQIYQRNQELHNVQMASEIRTLKEAFSAYLQAQSVEVNSLCPPNNSDYSEITPCPTASVEQMYAGIKDYLPVDWFDETDAIKNNYAIAVFTYHDTDTSHKVRRYGVIIPKPEMLPTTGWNFKRAARVALLLGADGGVWGSVNSDTVQGSLGTWHLDLNALKTALGNSVFSSVFPSSPSASDSRYVAITGLDIFTPEYEKVDGEVNLPKDWSLHLNNLGAYGNFVVGNDTGCYDASKIHHDETESGAAGSPVKSDEIILASSSCLPTFWVEKGASGNVYARNDLSVGMTTADGSEAPAIRLSKEGVILFNKSVDDPQDNKTKAYMLDPAYTSIMNDIKLMSRGGARLSDILPNYILKKIDTITVGPSTGEISAFDCPTNYKHAILITPHLDNKKRNKLTTSDSKVSGDDSTGGIEVVTGYTTPTTDKVKNTSDNEIDVLTAVNPTKTKLKAEAQTITATASTDSDGTAAAISENPIITVAVGDSCSAPTTSATGTYHVKGAATDSNANKYCVRSTIPVTVTYQTFCVFEGTVGEVARPKANTNPQTEAECFSFGGTSWNGASKTCTWS